MGNTSLRIISAIAMVIICGVVLAWGKTPAITLLLIIGILLVDEIFHNFFQRTRKSANYVLSQFVFIFPFVFINYFHQSDVWYNAFVNGALLLNVFLIIYVFYVHMDSLFLKHLETRFPYIPGIFILLPIMSLASLLNYPDWKKIFILLIILNIMVDIGAWFVGKNFGKHKLWSSVSPKKTIEGLFGGVILSWLVTSVLWYIFLGKMSAALLWFLFFLGFMSQLGDLIQSKIKRQFKIKDSSRLIPGHGGVYDRVDSIIFTAPFFATALRYFYY